MRDDRNHASVFGVFVVARSVRRYLILANGFNNKRFDREVHRKVTLAIRKAP